MWSIAGCGLCVHSHRTPYVYGWSQHIPSCNGMPRTSPLWSRISGINSTNISCSPFQWTRHSLHDLDNSQTTPYLMSKMKYIWFKFAFDNPPSNLFVHVYKWIFLKAGKYLIHCSWIFKMKCIHEVWNKSYTSWILKVCKECFMKLNKF